MIKRMRHYAVMALILSLLGCDSSGRNVENNKAIEDKNKVSQTYSNQVTDDRMLLVLSAPSVHDPYYKSAFQRIVDFQIDYAKSILGNDNVVIVVDKDTKPYFTGKVPEDILLMDDVRDIWMRDFTTVNPMQPVQFIYTWASMTKKQSKDVQKSFSQFADRYQIQRTKTDLMIDGGNLVDDYAGRVITTTRFMEDNELSYNEAKQELKSTLGATEVAILEPDEEVLAHSDGMVSWVDKNTLLVNDYSKTPAFRTTVMKELKASFPTAKIVEVPVEYKTNPKGQWEGFESACGVNLNATVTHHNIYVPTFNMPHDQKALSIIKQNTSKKVIPVNAESVCPMGGSVRCLTWQVTGDNAVKLIQAARDK
ncbi:peptidyl-arginine deiminase [Acinetobacter proteolyticus]|uniref:agmatine deiminase family protein n=1 Tax=Acinetobacter proteolyticus TaxID=1776741 RepID=UPI00086319DE|nr:agmatine deiminase family protein [Acinetobacter proteolyticus]OEY94233.1 peptidyl-arginine deiminase [Acinetobacter proteolyticus]